MAQTDPAQSVPRTVYLKDYAPPPYLVETVDLHFELGEEYTDVRSRLTVRRNGRHTQALVLDGQDMELLRVEVSGARLAPADYQVGSESLTIADLPESFVLEITTRIKPQENTALEGLYTSGGNFCTQCEAEGFRRITYFPDRPDVMARYTVTMVAERARYPVLLANGNLTANGSFDDGRHWATWEDPFPKPSYLFALVAGDLVRIEDRYTTRSGREVALHIYVEVHNADKCDHAMRSLKQAMQWDEEVYGLEYDLDIYMVVAVDDFNMGAMENKGLNIFNSKYVLARPDTATDQDYEGIQGVIGHEYFHNWTGNRITCRDWFQLSLKEGLTVFRDQQFSADMTSAAVKRIDDVTLLRTHQFSEDAGPMAHPVRPDSYIEINNFYTVTVYEKGAELVRMIHTLLGPQGFRKGMDLYIGRNDGQAVTTDDFVKAMEDANGVDLGQFRLWYRQAGTPRLTVRGEYDAAGRSYRLHVRQSCPPTPGQPDKAPLHIPLAVGLLGGDGRDLPLQLDGEPAPGGATTRVLELREAEHTFRFVNVPEPPLPSLLRGFSAPVKLDAGYSEADRRLLLARDSDPFNRWDAGQQYAVSQIMGLVAAYRAGSMPPVDEALADAFGRVLDDGARDPALAARILSLPSEAYLAELVPYGEEVPEVDPLAIHEARLAVARTLAERLRDKLLATYQANADAGPYRFDAAAVGRRSLKNTCLAYLMELHDPDVRELCQRQFEQGGNMTDQLAALAMLVNSPGLEREQALQAFYERWQDEALVMDKWFTLQATSRLPDTLDNVERLMGHPRFTIKNPNRVRALIGAFCRGNPARFHDASGRGYRFLAERVLELDALNPQIAARLAGALNRWRMFDADRRGLMQAELQRIVAAPGLSKDVYEVVSKALA